MTVLAGGKEKLLEPQVDLQEAEAFAAYWDANNDGATARACCTATAFRIDILDVPRSPWNKSAARVFYNCFVPEGEQNPAMVKLIENAFFVRIKSLKKEYGKAQSNSEARRKIAQAARRNTRKYLVSAVFLVMR